MSDAERIRLARLASTGDLEAAVELVVLLMRGRVFDWMACVEHGVQWPEPGRYRRLPASSHDLAASPVFTHLREPDGPQVLDSLIRWLVAHHGQVVTVQYDPPGLRCEPPSVYAANLEASHARLGKWAGELFDRLQASEARAAPVQA